VSTERTRLVVAVGPTLAVLVWVFAFLAAHFALSGAGNALLFQAFAILVLLSLIGAISVGLSIWDLSRVGAATTLGLVILFSVLALWEAFELSSM
jgi:hypothetical protein